MINKKANVGTIIMIILVLLIVMAVGVMLAFGGVIIDIGADTIVPEISNLGMAGDANLTQAASYTIAPTNNIVQSISWMTGLAYVFILIICLGLAYGYRFTGNKWLMGFFILCMFLVVVTSIFISNIYEGFYTGTGDIADRLQEQSLLSWLILYSPVVMCVIGFMCGVIMFTGDGREREESA